MASIPVELRAEVAPVSSSASQLLPVTEALAPLLGGRGLERGSVLLVDTGTARTNRLSRGWEGPGAGGATTLSMALGVAASAAGSWCLAVGFNNAGLVAMAELGMDLDHLAIVHRPGHNWAEVVSAALDGMDLVILRLPFPARLTMARRLTALARRRRAVLIVLAGEKAWPEAPDLVFRVHDAGWGGVGEGHGHLKSRVATVVAVGRRGASRPVRRRLWLPGESGAVTAEDVPEAHVLEAHIPVAARTSSGG
jgi:hypothetical protein